MSREYRDARTHGIEYPPLDLTADDLAYRAKGEVSRGWFVVMPLLDFVEAACAYSNSESFHGKSNEAGTYTSYSEEMLAEARGMCVNCPILGSCQEWGIAHEEFSIYGGLLPDERVWIRRQRGQALATPTALAAMGVDDRLFIRGEEQRTIDAKAARLNDSDDITGCADWGIYNDLDNLTHPLDGEAVA